MNSLFTTEQTGKHSLAEVAPECAMTDEQLKYVKYDFWTRSEDTMLIACAGAGKTRCMLEKMRYLAIQRKFSRSEMMVFSYSKLTIEHTKFTSKQYHDKGIFTDDRFILTIDAFAHKLLKSTDQAQVISILSIRCLQKLQRMLDDINGVEHQALKRSKYGKIKVIFIDEAQDLNQTQYQIVCALRELLDCTLHFIGDPNQNIYQFRQSYERYFLNHKGAMFNLSRNFRCDSHIRDFSEWFKFYDFNHSTLGAREPQPQPQPSEYAQRVHVLAGSQPENDAEIIRSIHALRRQGVKLNQIAIVSPNIGDHFNQGIIRFANLLDYNGIPSVAYYNELKLDSNLKTVKGKSRKNGVNLLTIHGSKGMEFHTVFITKFADVMLANESYDAQDIVSQNMNLLYVAVTRAQRMLYIVHDQSERKHICSLMLDVPPATYQVVGAIERDLEQVRKKLTYRQQIVDESLQFANSYKIDEKQDILLITKTKTPMYFAVNRNEFKFRSTCNYVWRQSVTQFIHKLQPQDLSDLVDMSTHKKKCHQLYAVDDDAATAFQALRPDNEAFIGILFEHYFHALLQHAKKRPILFTNFIFTIKDQFLTKRGLVKVNEYCFINSKEQLTEVWQCLNSLKGSYTTVAQLQEQLKSVILGQQSEDEYMRLQQLYKERSTTFLDFGTIGFAQLNTIYTNQHLIFDALDAVNTRHWSLYTKEFVYLTLVRYAIQTKHQKYMKHNGELLRQFEKFGGLIRSMYAFAESLAGEDLHYQFEVGNEHITGFIDFLVLGERANTIVDVKLQNDVEINTVLQLLIYDILLDDSHQTQQHNRLVILNFMKGVQYEILFHDKDALVEKLRQLMHIDAHKRILL